MKTTAFLILLILSAHLFGQTDKSLTEEEFVGLAKKYIDSNNYSVTLIDSVHLFEYELNNEKMFFIISSEICNFKGYNGNTTLGILFNSSGVIQRVYIIRSEDTSSFVRKIVNSDFLKQFGGNKKVRPISGATITCKAIEKTIQGCKEMIENLLPKRISD